MLPKKFYIESKPSDLWNEFIKWLNQVHVSGSGCWQGDQRGCYYGVDPDFKAESGYWATTSGTASFSEKKRAFSPEAVELSIEQWHELLHAPEVAPEPEYNVF